MQIINYKWRFSDSWKPQFMLTNGGGYEFLNLIGENLSFRLGDKRCVGHFSGGKHIQCLHERFITSGNMCAECQKLDDWFGCIRCSGTCINPKRRGGCEKNNYYIYLASFDSMLKVGMSFNMRFHNRLIEQGADFGTKIMSLKDGMLARQTEQKISKALDLPDRIYGDMKQDRIFANPNDVSMNISQAIDSLRENNIPIHDEPEIYDFRRHYKLHNILKKPSKLAMKEGVFMDGKIVAAKGNVLVLENNRRYYSFNAHTVVGRDLVAI
ncbi:MAG: DUF2797 domain-containing protein [Candidatus Aenigmatarchaeota archaeon]